MVLYVVYIGFFIIALVKFGPQIQESLSSGIVHGSWIVGGFKYAFYNLATIPAVLFCLSHIESRKEALTAGLLSGPIGIIPAFLFYIAVLGQYPGILPEEIPAIFVLQKAGFPILLVIFQIMLFGTLVETGTGMIHAVNQRIQSALKSRGRELARWQRPVVALGFLLVALGFSTFGLINLIAKGYGTLSWGFMFVYILPILTIGVYRIFKK